MCVFTLPFAVMTHSYDGFYIPGNPGCRASQKAQKRQKETGTREGGHCLWSPVDSFSVLV